MQRTSLIQRLKRPYARAGDKSPLRRVANAFAFGAGTSGLSAEGADLIHSACRIDYMGAAEFETGVFARVLAELFDDRSKLATHSFVIDPGNVAGDPYYAERHEERSSPSRVHVIARKDHIPEVERRLRLLAAHGDRYQGEMGALYLKERSGLPTVLRYSLDSEHAVAGWLELNNGWLAFTDRTMFGRFATLLGLWD